jgi:hypothetical protein
MCVTCTLVHILHIFSESVSKSELLYDWQFTTNQFVLEPSPLSLTGLGAKTNSLAVNRQS